MNLRFQKYSNLLNVLAGSLADDLKCELLSIEPPDDMEDLTKRSFSKEAEELEVFHTSLVIWVRNQRMRVASPGSFPQVLGRNRFMLDYCNTLGLFDFTRNSSVQLEVTP